MGSHSTPTIHPTTHFETSAVHVPLARPRTGARVRVPCTAALASLISAIIAFVGPGA